MAWGAVNISTILAAPPTKSTEGTPAAAQASRASRQGIYRKSDPPPTHDDERLASLGIHKYESRRLRLYTDIAPDEARPLPELMDRAYAAWTDYFGQLPPDREGTEFVMTGYLMADKALFRESGLLPEDLPPFPHGRNKGTRFWLNEQPTAYYRRHLLLHEGTHCFMTAVRHPLMAHVWYMEGMAELFGTHRFDPDGLPRFRVMPHDREQFASLGRVRLVEDEVRQSGARELASILRFVPNDFLANPPYAWSWALCEFLDGHPRYHDAFQVLGRAVTTGDKTNDWDKLFGRNRLDADRFDLDEEWLLFASNMCHGYDQVRAAIDFRAGKPLRGDQRVQAEIAADRGWQSTGVLLEKDKHYELTAIGRFVIAHAPSQEKDRSRKEDQPKADGNSLDRPWESEPRGISFRYHGGLPLGMLVATIRMAPPPDNAPHTTMLEVIPIGQRATITAPATGTLYLRVNDNWSELSDNAGKIEVQIRTAGPTKAP